MSRRIAQIGRILFAVPLVLGTVLLLAGSPARAAEDTPRVAVLPTSGIVDAIMAGYLEDGIAKAQRDGASAVEIVEVLSETPYEAMPPQARARIGMRPSHKNVLLRVVLRDLARSLTHEEANQLRDRIYAALHEGDRSEWACAP